MIRFGLIGVVSIALLTGVLSLNAANSARAADLPAIGCEAGDKIDGSTAGDALKKIEAAGYRQVTELKKGCSNYWNGLATKDGVTAHVSLSPQGVVHSGGE